MGLDMIARVFPRRTSMTPTDDMAFTSMQPPFFLPEINEIHISVAYTWDMDKAEQMVEAWKVVGVPVLMGGPAFNQPGGDFVPGRYVKEGYTITSRGCPNHCWFCAVWRREKDGLHELQIHDGWNLLDDNILACSDAHINAVFDMLARQKQKAVFSGGLEAKLLKPWQAERLFNLKPSRMYFAYDTPDDYEPLVQAGKIMRDAGFTNSRSSLNCYCLVGYRGDSFDKAEKRMRQAWDAGFMPFAMLYRDDKGETNYEWRKFQRLWARPAIMRTRMKGERD
jgi:hypothetical protein